MLAIAGVAAASVFLFAIPLALAIQQNQRDEELLRLQRDTVAATREIDLSTGRGDPVELPPNRDRLTVYDRRGLRVSGRGAAHADDLVREALRDGRAASRSANGRLTVAVPLLNRERLTGAVRAQRDDGEVSGAVHRAWLTLLAVALGVIALAVAGALLVGRRLAAPLERLAHAAHRLGQGDFSTRAPRAQIAELDEVAEALEATAQRLGDLVARERAFSADASHQLRTPLAALRLELEAVQLRGPTEPEVAAALAQVDRLQSTIDTLLAVARDTPRGDGTADLTAITDELERRWRGPLAEQGRAMRTRLETDRPVAEASPPVVDQVLEVLVENAHRHGRGAVTLSVREISGWVAVDVADEGAGLTQNPERAFARRAENSGGQGIESGGHGIGLALARSLATAEGGGLTASQEETGPVFTLRLPAKRA